ncbi:arabinosyltransferase domain-containing protein [Amycolatopsis minnesotensis]|uniref:Arabinosyltransferase domain-containing protein n=1 Tax=Amycolatopsis minnesotensis TaxID=337894 RepID=A0ABP5C0V2_9PSEU
MWTATRQPDDRDEVTDPGHTEDDARTSAVERRHLWRLLAIVFGLLAAGCALAFPFLPVVQDTAKIVWPAGTDTRPVNAPLVGYWAQDMRVDLPCATVKSVDSRTGGSGLLYSTVPSARSEKGAGMLLRVENGLLTASNRGAQVVRQPLPPSGCDVKITSDVNRTKIFVGGTPVYDADGDARPRVVGIYTDISGAKDPTAGLQVTITPDTRYQSSPTGWKVGVGVFGVLAIIACLIAVNRLDIGFARRAPRWAPVGWWRLTARDFTVFGALGAWVFIGPVTSDDGYILTMAKVTEATGYLTNYHRWFGVAEAPFGWFYHVYELMTHVSMAPPWIRLPSFLLGALSWLLISREVMPRLGSQVRVSRAAGWAAAMVFLVWWMPFNNGVRPEPVAAVGSLLALCAVERTLVTRRMLPLCLGLLAAAFTLAATPTGLIAVAPFLVAARPLYQLLRSRARESSWLTVLAPIMGAGFLVLIVIFADQTFASVQEATRLRTQVGPSLSWFEELHRYELLFENSADGSAARRFPVLLLILCTGVCLVMLLRRGRIQGAALGPARRLIGTVAIFFVMLALTPTKWTHHFGAFAAVGAAMAALTGLATSSTVLRSKRNRAAFVAGLLLVAALAATGPNAYWFVSNIGVPWGDKAISVGGFSLSTVLLIAAAVAGIVAFVENVRAHRPHQPVGPQEGRGRSLKLGSISLVAVCGLVAFGEFGSMAKAIQKGWGSYSFGAANVSHLFGKSCNLSDHVMVERDPMSSVLSPVTDKTVPLTEAEKKKKQEESGGAVGGVSPLPPPDEGNGKTQVGFHTTGTLDKDPLTDPPHGFKPSKVPMWSSYQDGGASVGRLRTDWYGLPEERSGGQVVLAVNAYPGKATSVQVEFGEQTPQGVHVVKSQDALGNGAGSGSWADVRISIGDLPKNVNSVRVVAKDDDLTQDGWVAVTAPRVPTFTTLTERVGSAPVYMDWPASFAYPCMNPVTSHDGISEVPAYRITAGSLASEGEVGSNKGGGPIGWIEEVADEPEVPSFLKDKPDQPWGELMQIEPYTDGAAPQVVRGQEVHPGWWTPGPGPRQPNGHSETR